MHIGDTLQKKKIEKESGRDLKRRYEVLKETKEMLGDTLRAEKPMKQLFGLTRGWKADKIERRLLEAQKKDNPQKYWWGVRKQNTS